jgi:hypothetical protein
VFRRGDDAPASSNDRNAASTPLVAPARLGFPDHAVNALRLIQLKVLPAMMTRAVRKRTSPATPSRDREAARSVSESDRGGELWT